MATFDSVRRVLSSLEAVEEKTIHGSPALYVRRKLVVCPAIHKSAEPNSIVVSLSTEKRSSLLNADPRVYYITEHYAKYSNVLVRLDRINDKALQELLIDSWQSVTAGSKRARRGRPRRRPHGASADN
jgi:hypothetical protein